MNEKILYKTSKMEATPPGVCYGLHGILKKKDLFFAEAPYVQKYVLLI